jgi:hypothetical protein
MRITQRRIVIGITMVLAVVVAAILVLFTIQGRNIRQEVSRSKVLEATRAVGEKFLEITSPVKRDLSLLAKWGKSGILDVSDPRLLNSKFIPLLESQTMVSSLILADTDGREYFLLREKQSWLIRSSAAYQPEMEVIFNRRQMDKDLHKTWREKRSFDPRNRIWFVGALQLPDPESIFWTEPYRFKTARKLGITASVRWQVKGENRLITVAALDILLDDLYRFLSKLRVSPGSRILLIRNDGTVMAPQNAGITFISPDNLKDRLFRDAMGLWEINKTEEFTVKAFSSEGKIWWAGFKPMQSEGSGAWIGVIIPEADLTGNFRQSWMKTVLMGVVIMISGAILMVYLFRRYSQSVSPHPSEGMAKESSGSSLLRMISAGENSTQEFKSTLRTNLKTDKPDKAIELAWLKSVTAFMNSEGGTLLVGINDESNIEGIEADGFENQDKCRLHVKNLINQHIGAEFSRHIDCNLQIVNGKTIVVITCEKATDPVFLKVGKNEDFFIRSGPSSIRLSMSKMVQYLKQR